LTSVSVTAGVAEAAQVEVKVNVDPASTDVKALAKPDEDANTQEEKFESVISHVTG
jgi:hypothetical protein